MHDHAPLYLVDIHGGGWWIFCCQCRNEQILHALEVNHRLWPVPFMCPQDFAQQLSQADQESAQQAGLAEEGERGEGKGLGDPLPQQGFDGLGGIPPTEELKNLVVYHGLITVNTKRVDSYFWSGNTMSVNLDQKSETYYYTPGLGFGPYTGNYIKLSYAAASQYVMQLGRGPFMQQLMKKLYK